MRILLLNQCFHPDVVATAQHGWDLARRLAADGHEVTAIASRSIYGSVGATLPPEEVIEGITVRRVAASRFGKASIMARAADFLGFYVRAAIEALRLPRQDVAICFTTPPFISLVGLALGALRGTRTVYWAMDLYPDVPVACGVMGARSIATRALERVNRACLRRSAKVVVLGRCMQSLIESKGIPAGRLELIRPWAEPGTPAVPRGAPNRYRAEWRAGERIVVMYSGNFGLGHDFETIVDGISALRDDPRFLFAMVGGGKRKPGVLAALRERGIANVVDAPYQPRESLGELLAAADVHLVSLAPGMEGIMVPSKFFGVAAAGRPVVCVGSPRGEIARCVAEKGCGRVVAPGDAAGFREALAAFAADPSSIDAMGAAAARGAQGEWSASRELDRWAAMVRGL
jgi:glycosyltransferase involved in cell wall biosynthesis